MPQYRETKNWVDT